MTTLPTWAVYAVAFGTPLLAFLGVVVGHALLRRTAAKVRLKRSASAGRHVSPSVTAIANARKAEARDLDSVNQRAG